LIINVFVYVRLYDLMRFFFFSSRRRHTRFSRDWSSDVCSSDLVELAGDVSLRLEAAQVPGEQVVGALLLGDQCLDPGDQAGGDRSEERRVGKEMRGRRASKYLKNKIVKRQI